MTPKPCGCTDGTPYSNAIDFFSHALSELDAARKKHPNEEGVLTDAEWLAVLTEEVGECARAIQDEGDDALRAELAQVAAMACRWYVSIPQGRKRPPWAARTQDAHALEDAKLIGHWDDAVAAAGPECRRLRFEHDAGPTCSCPIGACALAAD